MGNTRVRDTSAPRWLAGLAALALTFTVGACEDPEQLSELPEQIIEDDDDSVDVVEDPTPYDGPAYRSCVSDAQCRAGDACTTVPGYAGKYCAPACDPGGLGDECDLFGLPFDTMCLENGRCARTCGSSDFPGGTPQEGDDDYARCPETVSCQNVDGARMCAGETFGQSGYYGTCYHPLAEGTDCPPESSCVGGAAIGTGDVGICLPWCDDGSCPTPPGHALNTTTICYDIFLDHPMCALLCDASSELTTCPDEGQECQEFYGYGLCAPPGANPPF